MSGGSRTQTVEPWEAQKEPLKYGFGEARSIYDTGPPKFYTGPTVAGFDPTQQAAQAATLGYTMGPRTQSMMKGAENALIGSLQGATPFSRGQMSDLLAGRVDYGGGAGSLPAGVRSLRYMSSCFVDGVQVELVDGSEKNVSEINIGDEVKTDKGDGVVTKIYPSKAGGQKLYGFNDKEPFVTEAHPFMTQDGWKRVDELMTGDTLYRNGKGNVVVDTIIIKDIPEDTPVYNFHVDGHETYFADGYLVHNKTYARGYEPGGPNFVPGTGPGPVSGPFGGGSPYANMMQAFGNQMKSQLLGNVLPGIRQGIVEAHPGGSSVGSNIQAKAIAAANQQMLNKAAEMYGGAYDRAQAMRMPAAQMQLGQQALGMQQYPSIMAQPFSIYDRMGDIGDRRQAMSQRAIDDDISRYTYAQQAPQQALNQYMSMISGDYGSTTTAPGPSGLDTIGKLASIASIFMSDVRTKENIIPENKTYKGFNVYNYNYKYNPASHRSRGVMAQEVELTRPDAVVEIDGVKHVNYGVL